MFRFVCLILIALSSFVEVAKQQTTDTPDSDRYSTEPYDNYRTGEPWKTTGHYGTHDYGGRFRTTPYYRRYTTGYYKSSDDYYRNWRTTGHYRHWNTDGYGNWRTTGYYRNWNTDGYGDWRTNRYRTRGYDDWYTGRYVTRWNYGTTENPNSEFKDFETGETKYILSPHFIARSAYNAIQSTINFLKSLVSN